MINIDLNKNICLIHAPRTSSSILQQYLSEVTGHANLSELFNPIADINLHKVDNVFRPIKIVSTGRRFLIKNIKSIANTRIDQLKTFNSDGLGVFKLNITPYIYKYPDLPLKLIETNSQFIQIRRADVLYAILLHFIDYETTKLLKLGKATAENKSTLKFNIGLSSVELGLKHWVRKTNYMKKNFASVPLIYTEQFQQTPNDLLPLFDITPEKTAVLPQYEFVGNIKDQVINLTDVENFYEKFVNKHEAYFPQYFDKSLKIPIPASQGKQPRDLKT